MTGISIYRDEFHIFRFPPVFQSSVIIGNLLIIKKTVIEEDVHIGAHTVVMPGTYIGKKSILASSSATIVGQELEAGWIYVGIPAKKYKPNTFFDDNIEDKINSITDPAELQARLFGTYFKGKHEKSEVHDKVYAKSKWSLSWTLGKRKIIERILFKKITTNII